MRIGQFARAAGVSIQTIRFYERERLLRVPARTAAGYRDYGERDLDRLLFIRRNHEIGFTLAEIRQLLELHGAIESMPRPLHRKLAQVKGIIAIGRQRLGQVNEKMRTLQNMKQQLEFLVRHLEESVPTTCPVAAQAGGNGKRTTEDQTAVMCPVKPTTRRQ
jgi:DNA-binding transcriptional MerR regulator